MVNDKDAETLLSLLPKHAYYFFVSPSIPRRLPAEDLYEKAKKIGLEGEICSDINNAIGEAIKRSKNNDLIFVGGSTFVIAEIENL